MHYHLCRCEEQFDEWEQLVHSELERYHQLYDIYHSYEGVNNIKVINDHAGMSPVEVPEDILDLLEFSLKEYDLTGGGVHVGMGSVLSIWHDYREMALGESKFPMVPSMTELESAAKHMDIHDIHLDRQAGTVYLEDPEMRLDVGAVAKGYTAQRLADTLREAGVTNALLSLGRKCCHHRLPGRWKALESGNSESGSGSGKSLCAGCGSDGYVSCYQRHLSAVLRGRRNTLSSHYQSGTSDALE